MDNTANQGAPPGNPEIQSRNKGYTSDEKGRYFLKLQDKNIVPVKFCNGSLKYMNLIFRRKRWIRMHCLGSRYMWNDSGHLHFSYIRFLLLQG